MEDYLIHGANKYLSIQKVTCSKCKETMLEAQIFEVLV